MSRFVAIDVETANADLASICQIGVAIFEMGAQAGGWQSLVNPEDYFDAVNVSIHGIDEAAVSDAPKFTDIYAELMSLLDGGIVASHMPFDRVALAQAADRYGVAPVACTWLDTARVSRRAWPQFARRGYGLANVASSCGIEFRHHDAAEDARAAGLILLRAIEDSGVTVDEWVTLSRKPITPPKVALSGDSGGPLVGEVVVFTGALSIPRREAAALAASLGCDVVANVSKKVTMVIVGDQDARRLRGHERSSKHRRAEQLIATGHQIRILRETDFYSVVSACQQGFESDG